MNPLENIRPQRQIIHTKIIIVWEIEKEERELYLRQSCWENIKCKPLPTTKNKHLLKKA